MKKVLCIKKDISNISTGNIYTVLYERKSEKDSFYCIKNDLGIYHFYNSNLFKDINEILFENLLIDFQSYCESMIDENGCIGDCTYCSLYWVYKNFNLISK